MNRPILQQAWLTVLLLFPVALLNYMDRQMIAAMQGSVMKDLSDIGTDQRWGQMLAQFKWVYAFCSPFGGWVADRFGRRIVICGSLIAWSIVTWMTGRADSYEELLWTRTAMGFSEAFYIPAALAMIADYHIGDTRSRAVGAHQIGIYCGVIVGSFAGYVADAPTLGWRWLFNFTGLIGVAYAVPLFLLLRDVKTSSSAEKPDSVGNIKSLLTNGSFLLLVLYFTLLALPAWVIRDWMPKILQTSFNISQGKAGVSATLYWQLAAITAAVGGGWLADRWMKRTDRGRIYVSALGALLIVPALFFVGKAPGLNSFPLAMVGLVLFGVGWGWFDCNNMPILCQITRPEQRATGYGLMNLASMSFGGVADIGYGWLRDQKVPENVSFGVFAGIALLSAILVLQIKPKPTHS